MGRGGGAEPNCTYRSGSPEPVMVTVKVALATTLKGPGLTFAPEATLPLTISVTGGPPPVGGG